MNSRKHLFVEEIANGFLVELRVDSAFFGERGDYRFFVPYKKINDVLAEFLKEHGTIENAVQAAGEL